MTTHSSKPGSRSFLGLLFHIILTPFRWLANAMGSFFSLFKSKQESPKPKVHFAKEVYFYKPYVQASSPKSPSYLDFFKVKAPKSSRVIHQRSSSITLVFTKFPAPRPKASLPKLDLVAAKGSFSTATTCQNSERDSNRSLDEAQRNPGII